eukprot:390669-Hanusia_phi.AAC.1
MIAWIRQSMVLISQVATSLTRDMLFQRSDLSTEIARMTQKVSRDELQSQRVTEVAMEELLGSVDQLRSLLVDVEDRVSREMVQSSRDKQENVDLMRRVQKAETERDHALEQARRSMKLSSSWAAACNAMLQMRSEEEEANGKEERQQVQNADEESSMACIAIRDKVRLQGSESWQFSSGTTEHTGAGNKEDSGILLRLSRELLSCQQDLAGIVEKMQKQEEEGVEMDREEAGKRSSQQLALLTCRSEFVLRLFVEIIAQDGLPEHVVFPLLYHFNEILFELSREFSIHLHQLCHISGRQQITNDSKLGEFLQTCANFCRGCQEEVELMDQTLSHVEVKWRTEREQSSYLLRQMEIKQDLTQVHLRMINQSLVDELKETESFFAALLSENRKQSEELEKLNSTIVAQVTDITTLRSCATMLVDCLAISETTLAEANLKLDDMYADWTRLQQNDCVVLCMCDSLSEEFSHFEQISEQVKASVMAKLESLLTCNNNLREQLCNLEALNDENISIMEKISSDLVTSMHDNKRLRLDLECFEDREFELEVFLDTLDIDSEQLSE